MEALFWLCVVVRIVSNPLSNVFQKVLAGQQVSSLAVIGVAHGLLSVVCLPLLLALPLPVERDFWMSMAASAILAVAANTLIVEALRVSDLSFLGPVNAYKSVVSLIPAIVLLHEAPSAAGLAGIGLIVMGSCLIVERARSASLFEVVARFFRDRGVQYRLGGLVLSAIEAVFLKRALNASSPLATFGVWSVAGFGLSLVALGLFHRQRAWREISVLRANPGTCLTLAASTGLMQLCTLVILTGFQVAAALALFQTSALLSVFLGWRVFREPHFHQRMLGAAVMAAGAALIVASR